MITSISKVQNVKTNNTTYGKKLSNIAFQGSFSNIGKNIIETETSKVNGLFKKIAVKFLESPLLQKNSTTTELSVTKKPLIVATSMDPMDHISKEALAEIQANRKKPLLEKLGDSIFGTPKPTTIDNIIEDTKNPIEKAIGKISDNDIINPKANRLADSVLETSPESVHHVRPEDLVFGPDGNVVYEINPKIEAELNVVKLERLAQESPKDVPEHITDPKDIIWGQDGNIVCVIDHTEPIISSHPVIDHNPDSNDIDIDIPDQFMGV